MSITASHSSRMSRTWGTRSKCCRLRQVRSMHRMMQGKIEVDPCESTAASSSMYDMSASSTSSLSLCRSFSSPFASSSSISLPLRSPCRLMIFSEFMSSLTSIAFAGRRPSEAWRTTLGTRQSVVTVRGWVAVLDRKKFILVSRTFFCYVSFTVARWIEMMKIGLKIDEIFFGQVNSAEDLVK